MLINPIKKKQIDVLFESEIPDDLSSVIVEQYNDSFVIDYEDILNLSEDYGVDIYDAYESILEDNSISNEDSIISVYDYRLIENPDIIKDFDNIIFKEEGIFSDANIYVGSLLEQYIETGNEFFLEAILNESLVKFDEIGDKNYYTKLFRSFKNQGMSIEEARKKAFKGTRERIKKSKSRYKAAWVKNKYDTIKKISPNADIKNIEDTFESRSLWGKKINRRFRNIDKIEKDRNIRRSKAKARLHDYMIRKRQAKTRQELEGRKQEQSATKEVSPSVSQQTQKSNPKVEEQPRKVSVEIPNNTSTPVNSTQQQKPTVNNTPQPKPVIGNRNKEKPTLLGKLSGLSTGTKIGLGIVGAVGAGALGYKILKQAQNQPKTWIAKKIAALRNSYSRIITQAKRNPKKSGALKRVAAKILIIIDKLMAKLQNATN